MKSVKKTLMTRKIFSIKLIISISFSTLNLV